MLAPDEDATVRELIEHALDLAQKRGQHIITLDFGPEELGEYVMLVVCSGREARNSMARLLNTFLDCDGEDL